MIRGQLAICAECGAEIEWNYSIPFRGFRWLRITQYGSVTIYCGRSVDVTKIHHP